MGIRTAGKSLKLQHNGVAATWSVTKAERVKEGARHVVGKYRAPTRSSRRESSSIHPKSVLCTGGKRVAILQIARSGFKTVEG